MAGDLDIVGGAAVDVVPIVPNFHNKLKTAILPIADQVGAEAGRKMGERMGDTMRASLTGDGQRIGNDLGDAIGDAAARRIITAIPNAVNNGGQAARRAATRQGNDVGGAFARSIKSKLEVAFRSLPKADVRLGDTGFNADLARLRARMEVLGNKTIGVDIDAGTALAEVSAIDAELARLGANHTDVNVRADTAAARAQLALVQRQINEIDRDDVRVRVRANTAQAQAALFQLAIALGGVAALPLIPIAAAGIGAIASAAVAAGAGVGALALVAIPAIKGVTSVLQAKSAAEKEAANATSNGAAESVKAAQSAMQMVGAQQALSSAHRQAAQSIAQANRQVEDAERAVAQAARRAADQRRQAAQSVERAERSLSDAKRQARQAEEDLTQARKDAAQQLADLNDRVLDGMLDQREASLRVREAQEELDRVIADPKATDLQRERAQLALDQSKRAAEQQVKDQTELQAEAAKARAAGVDGNTDVQRAADRVADAQRNVQDQTRAVADAQREAARASVEAAQTVADAQRGLSDAVRGAADAQVQAADSIASAERGVESARLSGIDTTAKAATKADEYRKSLANLTPEQRDLYESIAGPRGLKSAFSAWQKSLQPHVLPLFTRGVNGAKRSLPGLSPLVRNSADAIDVLMDKASRQLKNPFWQDFKKGIATSAKPAIIGLGVSFGNIFKGMAGVVNAFFPHMDSISSRMQRITGRFAKWGTSLKGSPQFERFLAYADEMGPRVARALGDMGGAVFDVAKALGPLSGPILDLFGAAARAISWIAEECPLAIQLMYGLLIVTRLWSLALSMSPVGRVIVALVALGVAVKYAWDHFEWFRKAVTGTWSAIQSTARFAWESVLRPVFSGMRTATVAVGNAALWLWKNAISPAFNGIVFIGKLLVVTLVTLVFAPIIIAIQAVGAVADWLWRVAIEPSFRGIAAGAMWLWTTILEPTFSSIWSGLRWVGNKFSWLYDRTVKPATDAIAGAARWVWTKALRPTFRGIWDGLKWVGDKFRWLYDRGVRPPMNAISDKANWLYRKGLKPAFDRVKSAVALVGQAFGKARDAIKVAWNKVSGIAKKPVNFIIEWVYRKGIKAVWDKVAEFVGLDKLPAGPKLLEAGGTVGNGWGPAVPMKTNRPTAIVGEGNPRFPEYVIPTDPKYRSRAMALHQAAGTQLLAKGGVLGGIGGAWDWTKDTVSDVVGKGIDWAKTGADLLLHPGKIWTKLVKPIVGKIGKGVGVAAHWGKAVGKLPLKMISGLKDKIIDAVTSLGGSGGGGGGVWQKPVDVPYGTRFGKRGSMWSSGRHTGLDFPAATGTAIKAVADGRVMQATGGGPYGNHLLINHGGGLESVYAHLSKIMTTVRDRVGQGEQIGKVGATGNTTGPHLHLEARKGGRAIDPMPFLTSGGKTFNAKAVGAAQRYAKSILGRYGWGQGQFGPLKKLWHGESGWRWNADNPTSDAYGIPQSLPGSKMASEGSDWRTNYKTQVRWGLKYIKNRPDYGSPAAAYSKWLARSPHWYDEGGYLPPGLNLVANGTGKPEPVFTSGQWDTLRASQSGGATEVHADVRVYVGDREITDIVRTEVTARESSTATAIDNGRWG